MAKTGGKIRLDKWLWYARMFKTRSLAAKMCQAGKLKVNTQTATKANTLVTVEDVLTFEQGPNIRVLKISNLGNRRGPAPEARLLYEDLAPLDAQRAEREKEREKLAREAVAVREQGAGRPTKRERREMEKLRNDRF